MIILRNIFAVIFGILIGGMVNMSLITISSSIIPPPNGADVTTIEGLKASIHLFQPQHFIMPFLAHALGTFVGALTASIIAGSHKKRFALSIGFFFLIGGITNVFMLPAPIWFAIIDIVLAYLPMAFLGFKISSYFTKNNG